LAASRKAKDLDLFCGIYRGGRTMPSPSTSPFGAFPQGPHRKGLRGLASGVRRSPRNTLSGNLHRSPLQASPEAKTGKPFWSPRHELLDRLAGLSLFWHPSTASSNFFAATGRTVAVL
jgi:hypothetical protein